MSESWYKNKIKREYKLKNKRTNWATLKDLKDLKSIIYNSFVKEYSAESTLRTLAAVIEEKLTRKKEGGE